MNLHLSNIIELKNEAIKIEGGWNGFEPIEVKYRAEAASLIIIKCNQLIELINELN